MSKWDYGCEACYRRVKHVAKLAGLQFCRECLEKALAEIAAAKAKPKDEDDDA